MLKLVYRALVTILLAVAPVRGQGFPHKVWHYVSTHKQILIRDALIAGSISADAWSTQRCLAASPNCYETNPLVGQRPSPLQLWGFSAGGIAVGIAFNHLIPHLEQDKSTGQILPWLGVIPLTVSESWFAYSNVQTADKLRNSRKPDGDP